MYIDSSFIILLFFLLALLEMLAYIIMGDPYISLEHKNVLLLVILLSASTVILSFFEYLLSIEPASPTIVDLRTLVSIYGYAIRPVLIVLFCYVLSEKIKKRVLWGLVGVNAAIYLTALFSPVAFSISEDNHFQRGPLGYSCHMTTAILLAFLLLLALYKYSNTNKWETLIPVINVVMIIVSVIVDLALVTPNTSPIPALSEALVGSCIFFYIWLHLQLVHEHDEMLRQKQRVQIMMTQIRPHFLFNTLTTIQSLCLTDPKKAFEVTEQFGAYLRQNIESVDLPELIPIETELEHTRTYAEIERIRFPQIRILYDIRDSGFRIPPLTIQPLVENAIRHGVRIRKGGLVTITVQRIVQSTMQNDEQAARRKALQKSVRGNVLELSNYHEIIVSDNGKGFDVKAAEQADESHIGIRNVRERLERICGGSFEINSCIDEGTVIRIRIPVKSDEEPAYSGSQLTEKEKYPEQIG